MKRRIASLALATALAAGAPSVTLAQDASGPAELISAAALQNTFQKLADRVSPSVVAISASFAVSDDDSTLRQDEMNPDKLEGQLDRATRTVGTGFVLSADGYILTNEHVVSDGQQFWITTDDKQVLPAIVVGSDPRADLAVLKAPATGLTPARFSTEPVRRGQWSIAIGNPFGLAEAGHMAMSVGVISATERSLPRLTSHENRLYSNLIQTTAQINPGSSGGPLFDLDGEVIGVSTAVIMPQKQSNGIGFAMPITDALLAEVAKLRSGQEIDYGYIGVMIGNPSARERSLANVPIGEGVCINAVDPNDRAAAALQPGDIVFAANGHPIRDSDQFIRTIGEAALEKPLTLSLARDGNCVTVDVVPRKRNVPSVAIARDTQRLRWRGMLIGPVPCGSIGNELAAAAQTVPQARIAQLTASMAKDHPAVELDAGVMVFDIDADSPARKLGVLPGSVITAVAGRPVCDVVALQKLINDLPSEQCQMTFKSQSNPVAMMEP